MHARIAPLLALVLIGGPTAAEPAVAPLDPALDPLRKIAHCPARGLGVVRDMRIALLVGPEGLEADRDLRAAQARQCARRPASPDWRAAPLD